MKKSELKKIIQEVKDEMDPNYFNGKEIPYAHQQNLQRVVDSLRLLHAHLVNAIRELNLDKNWEAMTKIDNDVTTSLDGMVELQKVIKKYKSSKKGKAYINIFNYR